VVVVDADLSTILRASKVNLDLSGKVGLRVASREGDPVIVTDDLVPVTLARSLLARSVGEVAVSGQTVVIVRKAADTNGSLALGVDHRSLLVNVEHEDTSASGEASNKDPVVLTRVRGPLDLGRTAARRIIIIDPQASLLLSVTLFRAAIVELKNSIVASVAVAGGGDQLGASTDDSNPDTLHSAVIARAEGVTREHGVVLQTVGKRTTLDEPSLLALAVLVDGLLEEVDVEVTTLIVGILSGDEDVVGLAILGDESGIGAAILGVSLSDATHLIAVVIDLNASIKLVELVAGGGSDGLGFTEVSVAPPATTTLDPGTVARLVALIVGGGVAKKNIRETVDFLSEPALRVLGLLIRHDGQREVNTLQARRSSGNSDVVRAGTSVEDNLSTKAAVIIVGSNTLHTRTVVLAGLIVITVGVDIDDGIVNGRRASAGSDDELTIDTLDAEEHGVSVVNITALRESAVQEISLAIVVEGDLGDDDWVIAIAVRVHRTLLDGKSEATTGVVEASDEDVVLAVHDRAPLNKGSTIAGIVVGDKALTTTTAASSVCGAVGEN